MIGKSDEKNLFKTVFMKFTNFIKNCDCELNFEICDKTDVVVVIVTNLIPFFNVEFEKFLF